MKYILITAFVSSAIWFFTAVLMRLAFPIFPFLVILLSAGVVRFFEHRKSLVVKLIGMSLLFLFFAQLAWSAYYPLRTIKGALGIKSAELFLSEHERGFSFLKRSASFLDGESVLLSMGAARLFYSPAKSILYSHAMFDVLTRDGGSFESWLKKHHVTHILTKNMAKNVKHPLEFVRNDKKDGLRSNQFTPIISDTVYIEGIHTYGLWRVNL